jgi:hypothetical protein
MRDGSIAGYGRRDGAGQLVIDRLEAENAALRRIASEVTLEIQELGAFARDRHRVGARWA